MVSEILGKQKSPWRLGNNIIKWGLNAVAAVAVHDDKVHLAYLNIEITQLLFSSWIDSWKKGCSSWNFTFG